MADRRQQLGRAGEQMAAELLAGQGYQILARNWRSGRSGEIDLVAQDGACLVIVEQGSSENDVNVGDSEEGEECVGAVSDLRECTTSVVVYRWLRDGIGRWMALETT